MYRFLASFVLRLLSFRLSILTALSWHWHWQWHQQSRRYNSIEKIPILNNIMSTRAWLNISRTDEISYSVQIINNAPVRTWSVVCVSLTGSRRNKHSEKYATHEGLTALKQSGMLWLLWSSDFQWRLTAVGDWGNDFALLGDCFDTLVRHIFYGDRKLHYNVPNMFRRWNIQSDSRQHRVN